MDSKIREISMSHQKRLRRLQRQKEREREKEKYNKTMNRYSCPFRTQYPHRGQCPYHENCPYQDQCPMHQIFKEGGSYNYFEYYYCY